jgi:YD repeat-containing protein
MPLEDGREATVHYEDGCVYAYTYDEKDEIVYAARVRLVSEDPRED